MTEKHKNIITVALAALFLSIGLLYVFEPDGDLWEAIRKAVALPRSIFSFIQSEDEAEALDEIELPQEDQQTIIAYNPNETPFDVFDDDDTAGFEGTSPTGGDPTEINELPVHQVTGGGTP